MIIALPWENVVGWSRLAFSDTILYLRKELRRDETAEKKKRDE